MMMPMKSTMATPLLLLLLLQPSASAALIRPLAAFTPTKGKARSTKLVVSADSYAYVSTSVSGPEFGPSILVPPILVSPPPSSVPLYQLALAGAVATAIGDAAIHPMDCIKTLQQSDEGFLLSVPQAAESLWQQLGLQGFYRGLGTYLVTDAGAGAVKFGTYECLKQWTKRTIPEEHVAPMLYIIAGMAFIASSVVLCPGELLKQQLQMGHYSSLNEAMTEIFDMQGLKGFFTGYQGVCFRDVPYTMMELGLYDSLKKKYLSSQENKSALSVGEEIVAAAITGAIAGFVTTPLDTIKTKLMVDGYAADGFMHCLEQTIHDHGTGALFAGAAARVAWLIPFSAIYLPLFDYIKRQLGQINRQS